MASVSSISKYCRLKDGDPPTLYPFNYDGCWDPKTTSVSAFSTHFVHRANLENGLFIQVLLAFNEGRGSSSGQYVSTIAVRAGDSSSGSTLSCDTVPPGLRGLMPSMSKAYNSRRFANRIADNGGTVSRTDEAVLRVTAGYANYLADLGLALNEPLDKDLFGFVWDFLGKMSPESFIARSYDTCGKPVTAGELAMFLGTKQGYRVRDALEWKARQKALPSVKYDGFESLFEVIEADAPTVVGNLDRLVRQGFPTPVEWEARIENETRCNDVIVKDDYARVTCSEPSVSGTMPLDELGVYHDPESAVRARLYQIMVRECSNLLTEEFYALFDALERGPVAMTTFSVGSGPVGPDIRKRLVFDLHLESLGVIQHPAVAGILQKLKQVCTYHMEIGAGGGVIRTRIKFGLSRFDNRFTYEPDIPAYLVGKAQDLGLSTAEAQRALG